MPSRPFRLGRSLTGFGIFATRPIKKRLRIAEYKGPILTQKEADRAERRGNRYLYEVSKNRTIDGTPHSNIARYFNHSCNPNAESIVWRGRVFIKTLRNISRVRKSFTITAPITSRTSSDARTANARAAGGGAPRRCAKHARSKRGGLRGLSGARKQAGRRTRKRREAKRRVRWERK